MRIEEFKKLPKLTQNTKCDSIILLPTKIKHDSGYNYYQVVVCYNNQVLGKTDLYDTFSIFTKTCERVGIDCLVQSGLMRIFMSPNSIIYPSLHVIEQL